MHQTLTTPPASSPRLAIITGSQLEARTNVERELLGLVLDMLEKQDKDGERIDRLEKLIAARTPDPLEPCVDQAEGLRAMRRLATEGAAHA